MFKKLIDHFANFDSLPIEVEAVAAALVNFGVQDRILFKEGDLNPGKLQGLFYQFRVPKGVYADSENVTLIVFSKHQTLAWQRMICCKELLHVCDPEPEKTDTTEEVSALVDKILGPFSTEHYGYADVVALKDRLTLYRALGILFPKAARDAAIASGKDISTIAEWASLPEEMVELALTEDWPEYFKGLAERG